ncbi:MAG: hypothetical protein R2795_26495 [Saprospiraceae bacterium]
MADLFTINRFVLLVRPSQAMVDWINGIYPDDPVPYEDRMAHDNTDVYLIPEMDDIEDAMIWLEANYLPFFESLLEEWCDNVDDWPQDMDWEMFKRYADFTIQTNVLDSVSEEEDEAAFDAMDDDDMDGFVADSDDIDWD